jgi:hypothetical protein
MEQLLAQLKYLLKENHWQAELNQQMRDEIVFAGLGGWQGMHWSNWKPGSGWAMRSRSDVRCGSSLQADGLRTGAIGGGSVGGRILAMVPARLAATCCARPLSAPTRSLPGTRRMFELGWERPIAGAGICSIKTA